MAYLPTNVTGPYSLRGDEPEWIVVTPTTYDPNKSDGRGLKRFSDWNCLACQTDETTMRHTGPKGGLKDLCNECSVLWYRYGTPTEIKCDRCPNFSARTNPNLKESLCKICFEGLINRNYIEQQKRATEPSYERVKISSLLNDEAILPPAAAEVIKFSKQKPCTSCKLASDFTKKGPLGSKTLCERCYKIWNRMKNCNNNQYCKICDKKNAIKCVVAAPDGTKDSSKYTLCLECFENFVKSNQ